MKLYHFEGCPFCARVRFVLGEKKLAHQSIIVDPENPPAEFEKLSPDGMVPVLVDGDLRLLESNVINEYLEERYPEVALLPKDPAKKAKVRMVQAQGEELKSAAIDLKFSDDEQDHRDARETAREAFGKLSQLLGSQDYLFGSLTLADVSMAPFVEMLQKDSEIRLPQNIRAWSERLKSRPAFKNDPYYRMERD